MEERARRGTASVESAATEPPGPVPRRSRSAIDVLTDVAPPTASLVRRLLTAELHLTADLSAPSTSPAPCGVRLRAPVELERDSLAPIAPPRIARDGRPWCALIARRAALAGDSRPAPGEAHFGL